MPNNHYRAEIELSHTWYAGDRDQRDRELVVRGEGETPQEALWKMFLALAANGYNPHLILENEGQLGA